MFFIIAFLLIFIFLCFNSILLYMRDSKKCKLPGPKPLPILGNAHLFMCSSSEILNLITRVLLQFGDTVIFYVLSERFVFVTNPKFVEAIVSDNDYNSKADEYSYLHPWLGDGLLTASGKRWRTHRKLITPSFHFNILKTFLPVFLKNDEIFVKKMEVLANGKPINVFPVMALLALDNIAETAMGVSINAQSNSDSKYVQAVNDLTELMFERMRKIHLRYDFVFNLLPHKKIHDDAIAILHEQTTSVIKNRRRALEETDTTLENYVVDDTFGIKKKSAFLDLLLLSSVEGNKLDDTKIREEVDTFMFEGHDTTTSGLSFACYCISQYRTVQEKLFAEQKEIFKDDLYRHPVYSDLSEMKYLEAVIKESLRLYPSVPMVGRKIFKDKQIGKHLIPKYTSIIIGIMHMQRDPKIFEDPLSFKPERFDCTDQKSAYNWLAFSAGSRNCIGQKFAMMELKVVLSSMIRRFEFLPSDIEPKLCGDLVLRSENGVHVGFIPRK